MKRTPWFPPKIKPVRVGMYECVSCYLLHFWGGKHWYYDQEKAFRIPPTFQWRGVARKP